MDLTQEEMSWPNIPKVLKYVELRLPGMIRDLIGNKTFSNDEIGRIIRCIALDTDFFITPRIEAEVHFYRQKLIEKNRTRIRVREFRRKQKDGLQGVLSAEMEAENISENSVTVTNGCVTVTQNDDSHQPVQPDSLSSEEKLPSIIVENIPPIVPLQKNSSSSLEKKGDNCKRTKREKRLVDSMQEDLFSLVSGTADGDQSVKSLQRRVEGPTTHGNGSDASIIVQDIESDSRASTTRSDTRADYAWIPPKFEIFWGKYPRHIGKASASKAFTKLIKQQKDVDMFMKTLVASIEWWKTQDSWRKDNGTYIPYPATWLNRGNWEDSRNNEGSALNRQAEFLETTSESEAELIRRMKGE